MAVSAVVPFPGFTRLPHILEDWANFLELTELRVLLAICRSTVGWNREWAELSLNSITCAVRRHRTSVIRALNHLEKMGLIERERVEDELSGTQPSRYRLAPNPPPPLVASMLPPLVACTTLPSLERKKTLKKEHPPLRAGGSTRTSERPSVRPPAVVDNHPDEKPKPPEGPPSASAPAAVAPSPAAPPSADTPAADPPPLWHGELKDWLYANCPVYTRLDAQMFSRIAGLLSLALLPAFYAAARSVERPRKWAIYEVIAKQVAARGELPRIPPSRAEAKAARAEAFMREMLAKYGAGRGKP